MVRKLNKATIGAPLDLAEFLFGSERNECISPARRGQESHSKGICFDTSWHF
jgi:hypothetical protein